MTNEHPSYRSFLKETLASRMERNPAYSMRALAAHLGISRSYLTELLQGKKRLSTELGNRIAHRLGLEQSDTEYFALLIQLESTEDPAIRESLLSRLDSIRPGAKMHDLTVDHFRSIADWYCLPILELTMLEGFRFTPVNSARRLGISVAEAEAAIDRLARLGLLERQKNGGYRKTKTYLLFDAKGHPDAIRKFHRGLLQKALAAVEAQPPEERKGRSDVVPIDPRHLPEVEAILDRAAQEIWKLSTQSKRKTRIYALTTQFFNLTPEKKS